MRLDLERTKPDTFPDRVRDMVPAGTMKERQKHKWRDEKQVDTTLSAGVAGRI